VDGIDDLRSGMRRRFGDDVKLRLVTGEVSWWRRRLPFKGGSESDSFSLLPATWADDVIAAVEARSLWNRYGL